MNSAVVTGANGFIGQELVKKLSAQHVSVIAIVRNKRSDMSAIKNISGVKIIFCDMDHYYELPEHIGRSVEVFYHLAWEGANGERRSDCKMQLSNVQGALCAVEAAAKLKCQRFVGAGTTAELDSISGIEGGRVVPSSISYYGVAKSTAYYITMGKCVELGLQHVWARLSNTYGVGDYTPNFINSTIRKFLLNEAADFTSGEQFYDFTYVSDIAQGLYKLGAEGKPFHLYYVGSNSPRRLKDYIVAIRDEIDPSIQVNLGAIPIHGTMQPRSAFDCSMLIQDTGYFPQISFQEGIQDTILWNRKNFSYGLLQKADT